MMKLLLKSSLAVLFSTVPLSAIAVDWSNAPVHQNEDRYRYQKSIDKGIKNVDNDIEELIKLFKRFSLYLGFDLDKEPTQRIVTLLDPNTTQLNEIFSFNALFGATPVNGIRQQNAPYFVPQNNPLAQTINPWGNYTFKNPPYSTPSSNSNQGSITVSILMDQKPYQNDPVSQAVLNILSTPDNSYCMDYWGANYNENCKYLTQEAVMGQIIGTLPGTYDFITGVYNQKYSAQLNGNNLLAPLLYSTDAANASSSSNEQQKDKGLMAKSQAQLANNFILYASGQAAPIQLPNLRVYDQLYNTATSTQKNITTEMKKQAQGVLANYFANLRMYTARTSAGLSNLYYLMSKRMPQDFSTGQNSSNTTSQALEEFKMATWRLYRPDQNNQGGDQQTQWLNQINQASPATVQKEIAVLLAEINYQLYLNRQQQERILLTNTLHMLIQNQTNLPTLTSGTASDATSGE